VRKQALGFTLIEILVALFIFGVVALISGLLLSRSISAQEQLQERGDRLAQIHRAMQIMQRDILQYSNRTIRNEEDKEPLDAIIISSDGYIEMTRLGWRNPLKRKRSELQRISYRLDGSRLVRGYWHILDRGYSAEPSFQTLLQGVERVEFYLLDQNGTEHKFWPSQSFRNDGDQDLSPLAIILRIELKPFGVVERIWQLPDIYPIIGRENGA
jgi:general secretion pathway protein J